MNLSETVITLHGGGISAVALSIRIASDPVWGCITNCASVRVTGGAGEGVPLDLPMQPSRPRRGARSRPRRPAAETAGPANEWRRCEEDVVDALTLLPLAAEVPTVRCPRCSAAYARTSLPTLCQRNEGRCVACGGRRITSSFRRRAR